MKSRPVGGDPSRLSVTIVAGPRGRPAGRGLAAWLARAAPARARGQLVVALIGDPAMRRLNRQFRGVDRPTDVLAFPSGPPNSLDRALAGRSGRTVPLGRRGKRGNNSLILRDLGEIAIAIGVAERQAARYRHSVSTEVRVLALHGLLHLLGYDHERDQGEMLRLEARLRRRMNLPAGLLTRTATPDPRR